MSLDWASIAVSKQMRVALALILATLLSSSYYYVYSRFHSTIGFNTGNSRHAISDPETSRDPKALLAEATHFYWLNNGPKAAPLFARAEKLFTAEGDSRNELYAKVGRLRSEAETMSFVELSRILNEQLQNPIVQNDSRLRLWCLIAKGYTDIEIDYRSAKRDWLEAQDIAKSLGESQWGTRASGELGLIAFLEGNPVRAARLLGGALLSTMTSGDIAGQVRFLELLGRGFEEVNRHVDSRRQRRLQREAGVGPFQRSSLAAEPAADKCPDAVAGFVEACRPPVESMACLRSYVPLIMRVCIAERSSSNSESWQIVTGKRPSNLLWLATNNRRCFNCWKEWGSGPAKLLYDKSSISNSLTFPI